MSAILSTKSEGNINLLRGESWTDLLVCSGRGAALSMSNRCDSASPAPHFFGVSTTVVIFVWSLSGMNAIGGPTKRLIGGIILIALASKLGFYAKILFC